MSTTHVLNTICCSSIYNDRTFLLLACYKSPTVNLSLLYQNQELYIDRNQMCHILESINDDTLNPSLSAELICNT